MKTAVLDRPAFQRVFHEQEAKLLRMAWLILHDEAAAEDAVQETFTKGLARLGSYRGDARPEVWLYSIALNVCRLHLRKSRVREELADGEVLDRGRKPGRSTRGPLTSLMRRETGTRLAIALGFLTELQREVFILHYIEGLPYEAIAPMLDVSVVGARGLAHRARQILRSRLPPNILKARES